MAGRALDYRETIDSFVSRHKDLHAFEVSSADWESIELVTSWLKSFRLATTEMSATKVPMLSTTHAIFRGLQDDIKRILRDLPNTVSPKIKLGLVDAHRKLSDYYYRYDESPFYTWAALLDPRISYEGMKADYADDPILSDQLEESKANLFEHFNENYANVHLRSPSHHDIAEKRNHPSTNLKNISNSRPKTLTHVIRFTGGAVEKLSSRTYIPSLVTFCVYLVPLLLSRGSSQVVVTPFRSDVLVSMQTLSGF
ncbi:hypothetical protein BC826DRAFT_357650 [Russula brevipes]|nr:hypothetical protein BC826DRAFT_527801 [Russula brevipes]KAI0281549.1 hypothetical protein BC826DRAFT_357650 [Russula brevipes]